MKRLLAVMLALFVSVSLFAVGCTRKEEAPETTAPVEITLPAGGIQLPDVPF